MVSYASSLDTPGILARTVSDAALMFYALAAGDPQDSTCLPDNLRASPVALSCDKRPTSLSGLSVGIPADYNVLDLPDSVVETWTRAADHLKSYGARLVRVTLPHTRYALPAYYVLAPAEASSNLARFDGLRYGARVQSATDPSNVVATTRTASFGSEVKRRILVGGFVLSARARESYFMQASRIRRLIRQDYDRVFRGPDKIDVLLTPASAGSAPTVEAAASATLAAYLADVFMVPASLAGLPAATVPIGMDHGLPLGVQLITDFADEATLFKFAAVLELIKR